MVVLYLLPSIRLPLDTEIMAADTHPPGCCSSRGTGVLAQFLTAAVNDAPIQVAGVTAHAPALVEAVQTPAAHGMMPAAHAWFVCV